MNKIDYEYKSTILKTDLCKRISAIDKATYLNCIDGVVSDSDLDNKYFDLLLQYDFNDIQEARKINKASYGRVKRLKERITDMLSNGHCIFCTFTFSDKVLNETSADTRRQYVRRYLKSYNCQYVGNIDFGKDTGREHYHALVRIDKMSNTGWTYGHQWLEHVHVRGASSVKLAKYISKLTNHAIKETTKRSVLIYSR